MKMILPTLVVFAVVHSVVEAATYTCGVIPINVWGGSASGHVTDLRRPVGLVVVTHTVTSACSTNSGCQSIARTLRNANKQQGLNDISLSFLVGGNGNIYEGAGWKVGSHTLGYNDKSISLSFIGDFRDVTPTNAALTAAEKFLDCFVSNRNLTQDYMLMGHRQLVATISPGDALMSVIQKWPHWTMNAATRPHQERDNTRDN